MEELPRIIFGGAKLFLRGAFGAEIHSHQGTPPSRNSDNNKPPSRRSSSSTITGESAGQGSNDGVNSSKRNTPHKKSCKYGEKEESPQQAAFQAQLFPLIDAFIPKSFLMRILYLICWPITLFCFFYIYLPMKLWEYIQSLHVYKVSLQISLRKNELIRRLAIHLTALSATASTIVETIRNTSASEALQWLLQTWLDILTVCNNQHGESFNMMGGLEHKNLSLTDISELLAYEELEDTQEKNLSNNVMRKVMHNYIPSNPFKATVKIHSAGSKTGVSVPISKEARAQMSQGQAEAYSIFDKYSPASFPSTPFSRANVMHRTEEKTDTVMFAARDILRMEVQSASVDEHSHKVAGAFLNSGQMAVFDPNQSSEGIALSCGNHCAKKHGRGLCSSSRTMVPVPTNRFVYMEFSIQASNSTIPSIAIGLSPPDCPLNVAVGSWAQSIGLYSDLHLTVASRLYDCLGKSRRKVTAGTNIGMLVHIPHPLPTTTHSAPTANIPSAVAIDDHVNNSSALAKAFSYVVQAVGPDRECVNNQGAVSPACNNTSGRKVIPAKDVECDGIDHGNNGTKKMSQTDKITSQEVPVIVQFNIDGAPIHFAETHEGIQEIAYMSAPLYPTVSIMSEGTKVWCRMSEADQIYRSRSAIGAPAGVKVYCLDGSLFIRDNE